MTDFNVQWDSTGRGLNAAAPRRQRLQLQSEFVSYGNSEPLAYGHMNGSNNYGCSYNPFAASSYGQMYGSNGYGNSYYNWGSPSYGQMYGSHPYGNSYSPNQINWSMLGELYMQNWFNNFGNTEPYTNIDQLPEPPAETQPEPPAEPEVPVPTPAPAPAPPEPPKLSAEDQALYDKMNNRDNFYRSMETLNSENARRFMDKIEWVQDNGQAQGDNWRYGTNGMQLLSNTSADDAIRWKAVGLEHLSTQERQALIDAAKAAMQSEHLNSAHGGDGVFEHDEAQNWLNNEGHKQWKRADLEGESTFEQQQALVNNVKAQDNFYRSMETLNSENARRFMDKIEWVQDNGQAQGDNWRYGTNGMQLLSNTSADDAIRWKAVGLEHLSTQERQALIDAAKTAMQSDYLNSAHGGDGVFEPDEAQNWLNNEGNKQWKIQ